MAHTSDTPAAPVLIADSGATKTDWCLARGGETLRRFETKGISPLYQSQEEITGELRQHVYPLLQNDRYTAIFFYGTGCIPEKTETVRQALSAVFAVPDIHVHSDLIAAAHALCGNAPGIACILGTGSNSCEWDGTAVTRQVSPLGFILGDEGSGAVLGKHLVSDALKNQLTPGLKEKLLDTYRLTPADVIERVYRQAFPSRFLAGLAPFVLEHLEDPSVRRIAEKTFRDFFERNILQYHYRENKVNFVGSVAWHFSGILKEAASACGITVGRIEKSPMPGLIAYYK